MRTIQVAIACASFLLLSCDGSEIVLEIDWGFSPEQTLEIERAVGKWNGILRRPIVVVKKGEQGDWIVVPGRVPTCAPQLSCGYTQSHYHLVRVSESTTLDRMLPTAMHEIGHLLLGPRLVIPQNLKAGMAVVPPPNGVPVPHPASAPATLPAPGEGDNGSPQS